MALVKATSVGIGAQAMTKDLGHDFGLDVETDSSSAKGISMRRGVGKIRHLHTPLLWIQKKIFEKLVKVWKIDGKKNAADIGTKPLDQGAMSRIMDSSGKALSSIEHSQIIAPAVLAALLPTLLLCFGGGYRK